MIKRKFKAKVVENFEEMWFNYVAENENLTVQDARQFYYNERFQEFSNRISGNVVTITENHYLVGSVDYFEEIDNAFVITPELFEEIHENT